MDHTIFLTWFIFIVTIIFFTWHKNQNIASEQLKMYMNKTNCTEYGLITPLHVYYIEALEFF